MAAFSRSSKPMRPISLDSVILASGMTERTISALCSSKVALTGENTDEIAMAFKPASRIFLAISRTSSG